MTKRKFSESGSSESLLNCKESSDEDEVPEISYSSSKRKVKKCRHLKLDTSDSDDETLLSELKKTTWEKKVRAMSAQNKHDVSSDEEPLNKLVEAKVKLSVPSSSSDDESSAMKNVTSSNLSKIKNGESASEENGSSISSDEDKPISKIVDVPKKKAKSKRLSVPSSSSDDESSAIKNVTSSNLSKIKNGESASEENGSSISSDEDKPISKIVDVPKKKAKSKRNAVSCCSDDEPLALKSQKSANPERNKKDKQKKLKMGDGNRLSADEDESMSKLSKTSKMKGKPKNNSANDRVEHIKKYMRVAGIHIKSYDKLFEDCKSVKSKADKLINILHEKGLKGRPTLEKCKKLRKKIETKKEIAELDTANIIKTEGRPRRGTNSILSQNTKNIESSPAEKRFSRLRDIIDSEDSN